MLLRQNINSKRENHSKIIKSLQNNLNILPTTLEEGVFVDKITRPPHHEFVGRVNLPQEYVERVNLPQVYVGQENLLQNPTSL
jgi:hypothetical protein